MLIGPETGKSFRFDMIPSRLMAEGSAPPLLPLTRGLNLRR
jgi:hypothetical protein